MWRETIMDLLDQLEAENPEDASMAPRDFAEWACVYIKYLQNFRKLEMAYDQMVHPQKLVDMKKALEACMGRMLEIRHWLVKLNKGQDLMNIDDLLVDLKLTPQELELPTPRYFKLDRAKVCCMCSTNALF
jgi:IQ and AAA domain-containing protein